MTDEPSSPRVLGTLLVAAQALEAFDEVEPACAFLAAAVSGLPGVRHVDVVIGDTGATSAPHAGTEAILVRSRRRQFGELVVHLGAPDRFAPYAPIARNLGSFLGNLLDNADTHRQLAAAKGQLLGVVDDLEARVSARTAELALAHTNLRLADVVFDRSIDSVLITDERATILSVNHAFEVVTGWRAADAIGQTPRILRSGLHTASFYAALWQELVTAGRWEGEVWNRKRTGEVYPEWLTITAVRDEAGTPRYYVAVFRDLTHEKAASAQIAYLSAHDPLTGLPVRHLARHELSTLGGRARADDARLALYLIDLDNFRSLNESIGHEAGDQVLREVAARLIRLRRDGGWVGRHGGDEFLLVESGLHDRDAVEAFAGAVSDTLAAPITLPGHPSVAISVSIGIALRPEDGEDLDTLVRAADVALAAAKEAGRNNWQFNVRNAPHTPNEELTLVRLLRGAADRGELAVHYQPQVQLGTRRLMGVEALLRWRSPELGNVPPSRFIPLAERHGMIVKIGAWVLRRACADIASLPAALAPGSLAVNLSAFQFRRADLVPLVESVLTGTGLAPERLELELTESVLLHQPDLVRGRVRRLKELGVRLSIDDFGTGYSSLGYLESLDVDRLKIDRSFVAALTEGRRAIPSAVVQLGHALALDVVAEGIEDEATERVLIELGCDVGQGWLYGRPMPLADLVGGIGRLGPLAQRPAAPGD